MSFTTEEFPGRSFESFDEYHQAKKERNRILRELSNPKSINVEIEIEKQQAEENS